VRHISPRLCAQVFSIFLLLLFVSTAYSQIPAAREQALANLRISANPVEREFERDKRILLVTLREDFRQLQIVNNELMRRIFLPPSKDAEPITPKEIRASLSEIQSRARRLKVNFKLPQVEADKRATQDTLREHTLPSRYLILDETVMRFVENPIFQQLRVVDAQLSVQAAEDLDAILRLTDSLRKLAKDDRK
jgi:hypothetical protein